MKPARILAASTVLVVASVPLVACGVTPENSPRALPPEVVEAIKTQPPQSMSPATRLVGLWFIDEGKLVPVSRTTDGAVAPQQKIDMLIAGPTQAELDRGLRTAVTSVVPDVPLVATARSVGLDVPTAGDQVAVVLSDEFSDLPSQEQLLVLGQVVITLASDTIRSFVFVDDGGKPVGVPVPGGRLNNGVVTPADYASLRA